MKSFEEICKDHPQQADDARAAIARAHELFAVLRELEMEPNDTWTYKKQVKEARAEYEKYYQAEITDSKNPIIQELNAQ